MNKEDVYPFYFRTESGDMCAVTSPTTMYRVANEGSNIGNAGVVIDYYKTRKMVLKHTRYEVKRIQPEEFRTLYEKLFSALLNRMLP